jgi:fructosamine-3-kinase
MLAEVQRAASRALGSEVHDARALSGGDINEAFRVTLADGRAVFVKCNADAHPDMFPCEAEGLAWLAEPEALAVPRVLAVGPGFLALELYEPKGRVADFDERLGRGLAALHRAGAPSFGWKRDNFIAVLPQDNERASNWPLFYAERRLLPLARRAVESGRGSRGLVRSVEALAAKLPELLGPPEPPARLHGDLWGGNLHATTDGLPALIDPAVYGGHREIDLAMMRLFGGFSPRVFAAYQEAWPLAPGAGDRVPLYQLYPLLAHVNLFGGGYAASVQDILERFA